jgi:AraC-like DNA-binding protein
MIRYGNVYRTITELERNLPLYLTCVGKWRNQYPIERPEGYPDYQWIQCTGGQGTLQIGPNRMTVGKGQGMLLFPGEPHEYRASIEPWEVRWMSFNGPLAPAILRSLQFTGSRVLTIADPDPLLKKMYNLIAAAESSDPMSSLHCSSITYDIILDLFRYGSGAAIRSKQQAFDQLSPALRYIEDHCHKPILLQDLADRLSVTPQHTCVLFQLTLGLRPFEYITKVRMRKAKELMFRYPSLRVNEISRQAGYENTSYFIRIFRQHEGMTPSQFRKEIRNAGPD